MNRFKTLPLFFIYSFVSVLFLTFCTNKNSAILLNGDKFRLDSTLTLYLILSTDCPMCRSYNGSLGYSERYPVRTCFVFPGRQDRSSIREYLRYEGADSSVAVLDPEYSLCRKIKAKVTPQAVLIRNGNILYSGMIDDSYRSLTSMKGIPTINYLDSALSSLLRNETVPFPETEARGCFIEYPHSD